MDTQLQKKLERLGEMLALSPLSHVVKDAIIENAGQLTVQDVDNLLASLEREQAELAELARLFAEHDAEVAQEQEKLEREGETIARQSADAFLAQILSDHLKAQ